MDARTIDLEESFWRTQYRSRSYVSYGAKVDDYLPAYRYGIDASIQFPERTFSDIEETLARNAQALGTAEGDAYATRIRRRRALPDGATTLGFALMTLRRA